MSDFDVNELLPFYLDETDEQIARLNDCLLRLENDPTEAESLQEAFRFAHSIKGSARILGFEQVERLTHDLESYFDQLRGGKRLLERASLDVCFRSLDALRDFHRKLRDEGVGDVDLSASAEELRHVLEGTSPATPRLEVPVVPAPEEPTASALEPVEPMVTGPTQATIRVIVRFEPGLPWKELKASLILAKLGARVSIIGTHPPMERIEQVEKLDEFVVWTLDEAPHAELKALADVDGVKEVRVEVAGVTEVASSLEGFEPPPEVVSARLSAVEGQPPPAPTLAEPTTADPKAVAATEPVVPGERQVAGRRKLRISETLRVDVDRLDNLMNLAGELVINKARFAEILAGLRDIYGGLDLQSLASDTEGRFEALSKDLASPDRASGDNEARWQATFRRLHHNVSEILSQLGDFRKGYEHLQAMTEAMGQLTRIAEGIQKGVLDTRMVPIGPLFERFRRVVRDLSQDTGKQVELRLGGEATQLDKRMIDELADPLVHMIRNSVDHGLESSEERSRNGKPQVGLVSLQAAHRGNRVVITVSDDGRGIDLDRLRRKMLEHKLVREADLRELSDRQIIDYIWHPGLSTAERVTDLSGRGVGMDIVKSHIENLNGTVDVRTERGRGTTFTIRLPLTLAILPSLVVRIYDEYYAISLDASDEIVEVRTRDIRRIHGTATFENRGRVLALLELNDVFRWGGKDHPSRSGSRRGEGEAQDDKSTVVLIQNGETTMGLRVDELIGIQEVVLKSLERNFRPIRGLSGASIRGDGRVSLILDIDAIIDMACRGKVAARPADLATSA